MNPSPKGRVAAERSEAAGWGLMRTRLFAACANCKLESNLMICDTPHNPHPAPRLNAGVADLPYGEV
jgi:hypothetical protein